MGEPMQFRPFFSSWVLLLVGCVILLQPSMGIAQEDVPEALLDLNVEDLLNLEVTSATKKAQALSNVAAAVFVISNEDIRHSGATNIPDLLRMVPGLHVARIDSNKWAVTSRGFNGRFANKLLVLIDGRSVYSPAFSGVYWEAQDVMLEDIERIEVIRGPGATLWGANAVNGIVNVITKHAADTQKGLLSGGGGSEERGFGSGRFGFKLGEIGFARAFVKGFRRDDLIRSEGGSAGDDWTMIRGGIRADLHPSQQDAVMLQSHVYSGDLDQTVDLTNLDPPYLTRMEETVETSGWHGLVSWQHTLSPTSQFKLQTYYDHTERKEAIVHQIHDIFDLDFQHQFAWNGQHDFIWGLGYRYIKDSFRKASNYRLSPRARDTQLFSGFLQDQITLLPEKLWLTLGTKLEHNSFTGVEVQPTARLLWAPHARHRLWAAFSRAVRTPSRIEDDSEILGKVIPPLQQGNFTPLPVAITINGDRNFRAEVLLAYEIGYRFLPAQNLSFDTTFFYHDYENLRGNVLGQPAFRGTFLEQPIFFANAREARVLGVELAAIWQPFPWLREDLAYSFLQTDMDLDESKEPGFQFEKSPRHQVSLRSRATLHPKVDVDLWFRYVGSSRALTDEAGQGRISRYLTLDARLAWRPHQDLELSLVGQNLLNSHHLEFVQESFTLPTEVQRGVYGKVAWRF